MLGVFDSHHPMSPGISDYLKAQVAEKTKKNWQAPFFAQIQNNFSWGGASPSSLRRYPWEDLKETQKISGIGSESISIGKAPGLLKCEVPEARTPWLWYEVGRDQMRPSIHTLSVPTGKLESGKGLSSKQSEAGQPSLEDS